MINLFKTLIFIFCLIFIFHSFAKANENYQNILANFLSTCNSECKKKVFEEEINSAFINLFQTVLKQLQFELNEMRKEKSWLKNA